MKIFEQWRKALGYRYRNLMGDLCFKRAILGLQKADFDAFAKRQQRRYELHRAQYRLNNPTRATERI